MRPLGTLRTTNETRDAPGGELNEYERDNALPGTSTLTYWPGRNVSSSGASTSTVNSMVESDSLSTFASVPSCRETPVLHAADNAGTRITQSERGRVWHART